MGKSFISWISRAFSTVAASSTTPSASQSMKAKAFCEIPGPKPSLPGIGTSWIYWKFLSSKSYDITKLHEANLDKFKKYGPIAKEEFQWGKPIVHLFDPNDFEKVFRNQGKYPNRPPNEFVRFYRESRPDRYPGIGLAHSQGEEWFKERQLLAPVLLKLGALDSHIKSQNQICDDFIQFLRHVTRLSTSSSEPGDLNGFSGMTMKENTTNGSSNSDNGLLGDLQDCAYRLALESICSMCLDFRMGCLTIQTTPTSIPTCPDSIRSSSSSAPLSNSDQLCNPNDDNYDGKSSSGSRGADLISSTKELFESYNKLYYSLPIWRIFPTKAYKQFTQAEDTIYDIASVHIQRGIDRLLSKNGGDDGDESSSGSILESLIKTEAYDLKSVEIVVLDFIAAGIFTVSNSLAYLFYHLARNPHVQEKLYQELMGILDQNPSMEITSKHLSQATYLKSCIKESFRLTPTVPAIVRVLDQDTILSGYHVPKGVCV